MGSKCCSGEEASDQHDGRGERVHAASYREEVVKDENAQGLSISALTRKGPETKDGKEFTVRLKKTLEQTRLGIDVDLTDGLGVVVEQVNPGLIRDWNQAHPELTLQRGDRIMKVNGISNATEITEICKKEDELELTVSRK
ncbi:Tmtc4 [Symbiodinium natans]|uniref:Tmtc4 protein n=1 Tax=Symbiodinium natans TaxID=878477 RepID=A0A812G9S2_9DINO|nr:Tmtc4 [Symbiodinium natans]